MTDATARPRLAAVVPTLGGTALLGDALAALRADGGANLRLIVVHGGGAPLALAPGLADAVIELGRPAGFAVATNRGIAAAVAGGAELVALVNDDAIVEAGWLDALVAALAAAPRAAAAQGTVLSLDGRSVDGCGIGWSRHLEAWQLGHGGAPPPPGPPRPVFGVSATAALYRVAALAVVSGAQGDPFDEGLGSWYEDVDLACRLRAAGAGALHVPAARARHHGSMTGARRPVARLARIHGNRHLVLARALGREYPRRVARLLTPDLRDFGRALVRLRFGEAAGVIAGLGRAARHLGRYRHTGAPRVDLVALAAAAERPASAVEAR